MLRAEQSSVYLLRSFSFRQDVGQCIARRINFFMRLVLQTIEFVLTAAFFTGAIGSVLVIVNILIKDWALIFGSDEHKAERRALPTSQQRREERRKAIRLASAPPTRPQRVWRRFRRMLEFLHSHAPRHLRETH
jgi:hypothetical protein